MWMAALSAALHCRRPNFSSLSKPEAISVVPTYRLVIARKNQLLLRFLKIRVIVDGHVDIPSGAE
jgi:hypothetical protein